MAKEEILECLKSLSEKRMFSSEAEQFASPHKGKTLNLNIKVLESGRVFGRQIDSEYDDGHQLIADIGDELKASILIRKTESEIIENASTGNSIELDLKFLGYDSLYQRAVFGRIAPNEEPPVIETIIEKPESEPIVEVSEPFITDSLSPDIESSRVENSNEELLAEPIEAEAQDEADDLKFNFPKSEPLKKESKSSEKEKEKESNHGYYVILETVPDETIIKENESDNDINDNDVKDYCDRTNIITTISNLVAEFKMTQENFKMWSIRNQLSLWNVWNEAHRLANNCPALIRSECTESEALSLKDDLEHDGAKVSIYNHRKYHETYDNASGSKLNKISRIPERPTLALDFKELIKDAKKHIMDLQAAHLGALLLYLIGGLFFITGAGYFGRVFVGILFASLGAIIQYKVKFFPSSKMYPSRIDFENTSDPVAVLGRKVNKTDETVFDIQEKTDHLVKRAKLALNCLAAIIIWSGLTTTSFFIGTLLIVLTNWSKLIEKYIKHTLKKYKEGLDQSSNFD